MEREIVFYLLEKCLVFHFMNIKNWVNNRIARIWEKSTSNGFYVTAQTWRLR